MKTKKDVLKDNSEFKPLINAVIRQLGSDWKSYLHDCNNTGADAGYCGFIYYADTCKFAEKNRKQIVYLLELEADCMGENVVSMVENFGIFRNNPMDEDDRRNLYRFLSGTKCKGDTILNIMAWFALEEVARMFEP